MSTNTRGFGFNHKALRLSFYLCQLQIARVCKVFVNRPNLWLNWLFQVQVNASQSKRRNALDWAGGEIHIKTSSYKKRVLAHLNFSERPLWNSDTFIATFNVWSSKPFTLVFNIFWNFTSYSIHYVKFQRHACASSRIITPELTTQSCWLFKWRFFKYQYWYLKKSWCALICSSVKKSVFINEKKENDPQLFLWKSPTRTLPLFQELQKKLISFLPLYQKEEALTLQSLSISFTQWYRIIFHLPEVVGIVFES